MGTFFGEFPWENRLVHFSDFYVCVVEYNGLTIARVMPWCDLRMHIVVFANDYVRMGNGF